MILFEVVNGWMGESHVRVYAWAENEAQALELARAKFVAAKPDKPAYADRLTAIRLFDADAAPFATDVSDSGFGELGQQ